MDFHSKEEPEVIILDEEDCPFTIITVKIGDDGAVEETNEPAFKLQPQIPPINHEQVDDSSETDNSDDWTDDGESPTNLAPVQLTNKKKKRRSGSLKCPYCGKRFGQRGTLNDHIMTHTGEKPFKCSFCNKAFIQKSNLKAHITRHHSSEAAHLKMDESMQRSFNSHYNYEKPMKAHKNVWEAKQSSSLQIGEAADINPSSDSDAQSIAVEITYTCAFCDQEYPDEESLASHMAWHTGIQSPNSFTSNDRLADIHSEQQHEEEECDDEYSADQSLSSFKCEHCGKQCSTERSLLYHQRTHRFKRTFRCSICRRRFDSRQTYDSHVRMHLARTAVKNEEFSDATHNTEKAFNCGYCGKECYTMVSLSYHERTHRIKRSIRCSLCNKRFKQREVYEKHVKMHHKEETNENSSQSQEAFSCRYCGKKCSTSVTLSYHERTHRIERSYRCSICSRGFDNRLAYDRHVRLHSAPSTDQAERWKLELNVEESFAQQTLKSLICEYCGKKFDTEMKLSYHERSHRIQRAFRCSICKRGFDREQTFLRHVREHSKPVVKREHQKEEEKVKSLALQSPESYNCKYCGKHCRTMVTLSYHERTHRIKRTFYCTVCRSGFNSRIAYDQHMQRAHTFVKTEPHKQEESGNESYNCKYCGKQCNTMLRLSYHERTHRIHRSFQCSICQRGFNKKTAYDRHIRKHQEGQIGSDGYSAQRRLRPFSCSDCGERFSTELKLSDHEKTHNVQRAFNCSVCGKGFNRKQTYERHIKLHSAKPSAQMESETEEEMDDDPIIPESLICKQCGKRCDTKVKLSYHERTHRIKRTFRCSICNRGFDRRQAYNQHLKKHSSKPVFQANHKEGEKSLKSHSDHLSEDGPLKPFRCEECGVRFLHKQWLESHMSWHNSDTSLCCKFCKKLFSTKASYTLHMKSCEVEMPYNCSVCPEKFKYQGKLAVHLKTHGIEKFEPYSCMECEDSFTSQYTLQLHMAQFHKEKHFSCEDGREELQQESAQKVETERSMCKKEFTRRQAYNRQRKLHFDKPADIHTEPQTKHKNKEESDGDRAPPSQESFCCKDCGKHFSKKLSFERHMGMHKAKLAFPCSICKKQFRRRHTYDEHMKSHSGEADKLSTSNLISCEKVQSNTGQVVFSCYLCDKELSTEQELQTHMGKHGKNDPLKPFSCYKCSARYEDKQWLKSHMEIHNVNRVASFICSVCNKRFTVHSKYKAHMKLHTAIRPYSCSVCNKRFNRRIKLEEHTNIHTGERPFSCPLCLKKFSSSSGLKRHVLTHESRNSGVKREDRAIDREYAAVKNENTAIKNKKTAIKNKKTAIKNKNTAIKNVNAAIKNENTAIKKKNTAIKNKKTAIKNESAAIKNKNTAIKNENTAIKNENTGITNKNMTVKNENTAVKKENATIKSENTTIRCEKRDLKSKNTDLKSENTDTKSMNIGAKNENTDIKSDYIDSKHENTDIKRENTDVKSENTDVKSENTDVKSENTDIKGENTDIINDDAAIRKEHSVTKRGLTFFNCEECGKRYTSEQGLIYHQAIHSNQVIRKMFHCSMCSMRFNKKLSYDWHVRMHCPKPAVKSDQQEGEDSGEQSLPFSCEVCGERFSDDVHWEHHKNTHKNYVLFTSSACNTETKEVCDLHMKTHEEAESDVDNKADLKE